jgi:hypothetical protein
VRPEEIIFKALAPEDEIQVLASRLESRLARALLSAFDRQRGSIDMDELARALQSGDIARVLAMLDVDSALAGFGGIGGVIQDGAYAAGTAATAQVMTQIGGLEFAFNRLNPRLITWLQTYALGLIRQINDETKEAIRQRLIAGVAAGKGPVQYAKEVRSVIGLTTRQAQAVSNFRRELETFHMKRSAASWNLGGKIDRVHGIQVLRPDVDGSPKDGVDSRRLRDFRYDNQLKRALSSGKALSQAQIDKMVDAYARKYLKYRSQTIARTEAIRTNNMGIADAWQQAIDAGRVNEALTRKLWVVARDERLCRVCGPIPRMNPKLGVGHGQPFRTPKGPHGIPPMHPNCRCTIFYRVYEPVQIGNENGQRI